MESFMDLFHMREHEIATFDSYGNNSWKTKAWRTLWLAIFSQWAA
jgi:hypothetical protein